MSGIGALLSLHFASIQLEIHISVKLLLYKNICLRELIASVHRKNKGIGDLYFSFIQNSNGGCFNQPDGALRFPPLRSLR